MATTHRIIDAVVDPLELPDATVEHAFETAREQAVTRSPARLLNLAAACGEIERWAGRVLWPGDPPARTSTAIVEVTDSVFPVAMVPSFPLVAGVTVALTSVKKWNETTGAFEDADHKLLPAARLKVPGPGTYEVVAEVTPADPIPLIAVEAASGPSRHNLLIRTWVTARNHRRITAPHTRTFNHGAALAGCGRTARLSAHRMAPVLSTPKRSRSPVRSTAAGRRRSCARSRAILRRDDAMAGRRATKIYRTARWRRVRLQVLVRDKWRCRRCNGFAFEVHHVKPIAEDGDAFDDSNLEARCRGCHMNEHGKGTSRDWRRLLADVLT